MKKLERYEVPTTAVFEIALKNGILFGSPYNDDGNEMPIDDSDIILF